MASISGIPLSKVSPAFLHANSTSHTWAFSAFAELIDNAYDPDVSASELLIDKVDIRGYPCLIFLDNGAGMDRDHLLKMLSFGFCEKDVYERQGSHQPIGHYGNGFKSGSMRLGQDALVFTRCQTSASIGFLSQTYLKAIKADSVIVPILEYRLPKLERIKSQESRNNLNAILQYSVFNYESELKEELRALEGSKTGTKIIIYHLKRLQGDTHELDFSSDPRDIRCPEAHETDNTSVYHRPILHNTSEYKRSLREYCSILFLRPRMKITIRGVRVKSKLISKSLSNTEIDMYKPTWLSRPVKIIFGFTCDQDRSEDYGMMLYHRNRLIKAYEKVGYQKQPNDLGIGVVGVAQVDFLQPIHNKQDFNKDEKFNSVMSAFANKLNEYWNEKKTQEGTSSVQPALRNLPDWLWAQCDQCLKWRRLPDGIDGDALPDRWFCRMNPDATHNRCDIPEEPEDEDLAVRPTYEKTYKKKQEEKKRLQQMEREKEEAIKRMNIQQKEKELKEKEAVLRAIQHVAATQPAQENRTVTSLQKALAEAKKREEQQKRLILQMQEQKKQMEEQRNSLLQMAESLQSSKGKKSKNVLDQMSHLLGSVIAKPAPVAPSKRKSADETPSPSVGGSKRLRIKTESGEVLSITRNDINGADDEDDNAGDINFGQNSPSTKKQKQRQQKADSLKLSSNFPLSKPQSRNDTTPNIITTQTSEKTAPRTQDASAAPGSASTSSPSASTRSTKSTPTSSKSEHKSRQKGAVVAVIDLTSESEFGELVDVKPNLEELRSALRDNLVQENDVKPDKDKLDAAMDQTDKSTNKKASSQELLEAKEEVVETPSDTSARKESRAAGEKVDSSKADDQEKVGIQFGPAEDDPEFGMDIPESFQDNLEAAMAAIQDRIEKEKDKSGQDSTSEDVQHKVDGTNEVGGEQAKSTENSESQNIPQKSSVEVAMKGNIQDESMDVSRSVDKDSRGKDSKTEENKKQGETSSLEEGASTTVGKFMAFEDDDIGIDDDFGLDDDDNDYRGSSAVDEKGDSGDSLPRQKKCEESRESSRNNSTEDKEDSHREGDMRESPTGGSSCENGSKSNSVTTAEECSSHEPSVRDSASKDTPAVVQEKQSSTSASGQVINENVQTVSSETSQTNEVVNDSVVSRKSDEPDHVHGNVPSEGHKPQEIASESVKECRTSEVSAGVDVRKEGKLERNVGGDVEKEDKSEGNSNDAKSRDSSELSTSDGVGTEDKSEKHSGGSCINARKDEELNKTISQRNKEGHQVMEDNTASCAFPSDSFTKKSCIDRDQDSQKSLSAAREKEEASTSSNIHAIDQHSVSHKTYSSDNKQSSVKEICVADQKMSSNSKQDLNMQESFISEPNNVQLLGTNTDKKIPKDQTISKDPCAVDDTESEFIGFRDESDSGSQDNSVTMSERPSTPEDLSLPLSPPPSDHSPVGDNIGDGQVSSFIEGGDKHTTKVVEVNDGGRSHISAEIDPNERTEKNISDKMDMDDVSDTHIPQDMDTSDGNEINIPEDMDCSNCGNDNDGKHISQRTGGNDSSVSLSVVKEQQGTSCSTLTVKKPFDKDMQTDLNMSSLEWLCHHKNETACNKSLSDHSVQTDVGEVLKVTEKSDKSLQTSGLEKTLSERDTQTDNHDNDEETVTDLRTKLKLKTQLLEEMEERFSECRANIHKLLGFIVPHTDLGDVQGIEQMVRDMIRVNEESSQQSQSQDTSPDL